MTAGRKVNSLSQEWGTPQKYVDAIKEFFDGSISLDPCSSKYSIIKAEVEYLLPKHDGLIETWNYPTIYVNPPYGITKSNGTSISNWLKRCADANNKYNSEVLALVPVATNTGHWKKYVFGEADAICFLYDTRLKFLVNGINGGKGAPMACAMIYWGKDFQKFYNIFILHGAVLDISQLQGVLITPEKNPNQQSLFQ